MTTLELIERGIGHNCLSDAYDLGRADGYSQAENDYHKQTEKDRKSSYDCGYQQGRADKYQEITSEYMLLTEKQVAEIRADAFNDFETYAQKWADRQECIGRKVVKLVVNELIDSAKELKEQKE